MRRTRPKETLSELEHGQDGQESSHSTVALLKAPHGKHIPRAILIVAALVAILGLWSLYFIHNTAKNIGAGTVDDSTMNELRGRRGAEMEEMAASLLIASEQGTLEQEIQRLGKKLAGEATVKDSTSATVIALASGYGLDDYRRFVGSLRMTGYKGHIILGMSPDMKPGVREYLERHHVTMKLLQYTNCTYELHENAKKENPSGKEMRTCAVPYPNIKIRWSRFPLARDWLKECKECTGPVLVSDFRDLLFQRDPFVDATITGLQVFEEHHSIRTTHWLVRLPVSQCKGIQLDEPMLCSGTTVGTRDAMLKYLSVMYKEMMLWMENPKRCDSGMVGDDQSIHNYLYYTGKLPFAMAVPHRMGIVNTVGAQGSILFNEHAEYLQRERNMTRDEATWADFYGSDGKKQWLARGFDLIDSEGYFINYDGTRSRVVHQYDRLGRPFVFKWLPKQEGRIWK